MITSLKGEGWEGEGECCLSPGLALPLARQEQYMKESGRKTDATHLPSTQVLIIALDSAEMCHWALCEDSSFITQIGFRGGSMCSKMSKLKCILEK